MKIWHFFGLHARVHHMFNVYQELRTASENSNVHFEYLQQRTVNMRNLALSIPNCVFKLIGNSRNVLASRCCQQGNFEFFR
jgi:hypothetical protein